MRLLIAKCEVVYQGRLGAHLPPAIRLVLLKADGSIAVHSDTKAYKPLNWMSPPCEIIETEEKITVTKAKGERLDITLHEVLSDYRIDMGEDPGLAKDGVEAELQALLRDRLNMMEDGLTLIRREYPTDIGPVDFLCRDTAGETVVIEVKRIGEISGVEQLVRYRDRLSLDPLLAPLRALYVATKIKPQAKVLAESQDIRCVEIPLEKLRETEGTRLSLF